VHFAATHVHQLLTWFAVTAALLYWARSWQRSRTPGLLAMVKALAALDVALILGTDFGLGNWLFGIATLPNYIVHVFALCAAYFLQLFVLYLAHPASTVPQRTRSRRRLVALAQLALGILYLLGPMHSSLPGITASEGDHAFVVAYLAVFELYLGLAMFDVVWVGRHAKDLPRGYLRTGLRLLRWGGIAGLAFVVHKALYSIVVNFGFNPPWAEMGNVGVSRVLTTAGILLLMAGVTVPAIGPRNQLRRNHRDLEPLWQDLITYAPEARFQVKTTRRTDITDRIRQRLTEINDVLVGPLQPYLDPAVYRAALASAEQDAGHGEIPAPAIAQAATIAAALNSTNPASSDESVPFPSADTADYREESAWVAHVANAYVRLTRTAPNAEGPHLAIRPA